VPVGVDTRVPELQQAYDELIRFLKKHLRIQETI